MTDWRNLAGAREALGVVGSIAVAWLVWRLVDLWISRIGSRPEIAGQSSARALHGLLRNVAKVGVISGAALGVLAALGYPVTTVLAGLGIGGIALALGAQKTLENLFGSIALALDQPFRPGDFVKIDPHSGHVEEIGLRSTRIRTLDRTVVSIPNGALADLRVEDFASRDRIRLATTLSLESTATAAQVEATLQGCEAVLRAQPRLVTEGAHVKLLGFAPGSIHVEVVAQFDTSDVDEFRAIRQEILLGFMRAIESAGARLAPPAATARPEGA